jgi:1,4-dihydroxy-2-naphthoate octaprenyltransferase
MGAVQAILGVIRAPFLLLPVVLVAAGAAAAAYDGGFDPIRTLVALVGLLALHVAVNSLNEAGDFRTGIDLRTRRTPFSGGSGTLPAGALRERTARAIGYAGFLIGAACGCWFLPRVGWPLVPLVVIGAVSVLGYTGWLARTGCGELSAGLGLGALPVLGTALVQEGRLGPAAWAASVPAFLMTFNLLLLNEFPDEAADRRGGRRNLVLLLGRRPAARIYALAALATPLWILASVGAGWLPRVCLVGALPFLLLLPALRSLLHDAERPVPVPHLGSNVIWNLATNALLAAALGWAAR